MGQSFFSETPARFTAAVVQAAPVLFHKKATIQKAVKLILEAAKQGATGAFSRSLWEKYWRDRFLTKRAF